MDGPQPAVDDADWVRAKYAAARDKPLRADGVDQFVEVTADFSHYADDPYTERTEREPVSDHTQVLVIGGGLGSLIAAARLQEAGITDIRMVEPAGDFGGTWCWNRYPGAQCGIESYIYLALLEELNYIPTERYAHGPEIRPHLQAIARHYGLYRNALLQNTVTNMFWDDDAQQWVVETDRNDRLTAAAEYRETLDKALVEQGRAPGSVPPIPGLIPYLGRTTTEAEEKLAELDSYVDWEPIAPFALGQFGLDIRYGDINDPFPTHELPRPQDVEKTIKSTFGNYVGLYTWIQERPGVTVREVVAQAVGRGGATHRKFVGTYDALVEDFAAWHADSNVGGFNLMFSAGSAAIREFIDEVVPRLIDRGIYRSSPHDRPLRERF